MPREKTGEIRTPTVEDVIKSNRKFGRQLQLCRFTVSSTSGKPVVKFGKKLNVVECPTIEAAQELADGLNATIQIRAKQYEEFIRLMEFNCQQINLFPQLKSSVSDDEPVPTENPYDGLEEASDNHQS